MALVFQHINPEDAGLYTCVASTSTGKISCSAELSVEGGVTQLLKVCNFDCDVCNCWPDFGRPTQMNENMGIYSILITF